MKLSKKIIAVFTLSSLFLINPLFAEPVNISFSFEPDLHNGRLIFETCAACHLPEGWGNTDGAYPQIAGQHQNVLMQQLLGIRSGERENPTMYPFVQQRTIGGYKSMADVVVYVSRLPMHPRHKKGPWSETSAEYSTGKNLYQKHCAACHGNLAEGNNETFTPQLYGQHFPYVSRQINQIKSGFRKVNPIMKAVVDQLDDKQIEQIINYVSYLPVPENKVAPSLDWRNKDFY